MSRRAFTLIEVLMVVVLIGVLGTLGFPAYQNFIENSKAKACQAHLEALKGALDMYALDLSPSDTMPASLSQLPDKYIKASYARLMQEPGAWKIKLAYFVMNLEQKRLAYAATCTQGASSSPRPLVDAIVKGNKTLLLCPADANPENHGCISYGINSQVIGKTAQYYNNLGTDVVVLGDSDAPTFQDETKLVSRHVYNKIFSRDNYAQGLTKGKKIIKPRTGQIPHYTYQHYKER